MGDLLQGKNKGNLGRMRMVIGVGGAICLLGGGIFPAHGQDLQGILRTIDRQQEKIQTLAASFYQKRETSLVQGPLVSRGIIKFKRPDRVHLLYLQPELMEMAFRGGKVQIYYPSRSQAETYLWSRNSRVGRHLNPLMGIFQKSLGRLATSYAITYQGLEGDGTYRFRLQPREEEARKFLLGVDLWIDKNSGAILRFEMVEINQDRLKLEFRNLQVNSPLTDDDLSIKIPSSVRIQEQKLP
jgi:outer membrane lipoprotein-sorting protein